MLHTAAHAKHKQWDQQYGHVFGYSQTGAPFSCDCDTEDTIVDTETQANVQEITKLDGDSHWLEMLRFCSWGVISDYNPNSDFLDR